MGLSDENTREGRHLTPEERIALQAEEIKQLQQENNGWRERYDELDAGHSRLFKDFCKLQQENEQLRAQVAAMKTAICNMCRGKECDNCAFGDANITETIKHWRPERVCLNPADVETLRKAREAIQRAKENFEPYGEYEYDVRYDLEEALAKIDKAIGGETEKGKEG